MKRLWLGAVILATVAIAAPAAQLDISRLLDDADASMRASNPTQARALYEQALGAARAGTREPELARALFGLGQVARRERRIDDARASFSDALAIYDRLADHAGIARASHQLAEMEGDVARSGGWFERAAAAARLAGMAGLEGEALHDYGDRLFNSGRYEEALERLSRAAALYESAGARVDLGTVYNSIGRVYRAHGRLDEALQYQHAALKLHRTAGHQLMLVQSLNAVAVIYQRLHDLKSARAYLEEALAEAAKLPASASTARAQDFLRANMADLLADLGQLAPAATALEQVIAGGRDEFRAERYTQLSRAYHGLGRGEEALAAAEQAVSLCGQEPTVCIVAYNARSDAHAALGHRDLALLDLSQVLSAIENLRARLLPSDLFKRDFTTYYKDAYSNAIARQLEGGRDRDALETAELARSRAFLDLLASRAIAPAVVNASPALPLTLRGGPATSVASPATMPSAKVADLARTAERLRSTLLLYWVGADETVIWVVKADGAVQSRRVNVKRARLDALVRETAPFATAADGRTPVTLREPTTAWRELYRLLIAPVKADLPTAAGSLLTIVPHDVLANLSYAALQDGRGRYLLEDYALHYAPAGALLQFTAAQPRLPSRVGPVLMVADPQTTRRSKLDVPLPPLPGARLEASAITREWRVGEVLALSGQAATESAVREQAATRSILHFAAHTVVRDDDPFASYLALARSSADEDADGVLTAQEVYRLSLRADLVVLSGCRSASGTIAGDGMATFARAFLYAGAASLMASVWEVADQPSHRLFPTFYRAWLGGDTKASALRKAQLELLADLRAGRVRVPTAVGPIPVPEHPVFWAGFSLFGEPN
jgi:CHAT domain-containing protein/tetratricopeptide (TPR) repeat protein